MATLRDLSYLMLFIGVMSANIGLSQVGVSVIGEEPLSKMPVVESSVVEVTVTSNMTVLPQEVFVELDETFVINVAVENVSDMYAWQVHLYFDSSIIECVDVFLPHNYVFSYAHTVGVALVEHNSSEFRNPIRRIRNDKGWLLAGDVLLGNSQTTFNGSGSLIQVEFNAVSSGSSVLELSTNSAYFGTYIINSGLQLITPLVFNSKVLVEHDKH